MRATYLGESVLNCITFPFVCRGVTVCVFELKRSINHTQKDQALLYINIYLCAAPVFIRIIINKSNINKRKTIFILE